MGQTADFALESFRRNTQKLLDRGSKTRLWLAEKSGIAPTHVSKYLNGSKDPTIVTIARFAEALDTTVAELLEVDNVQKLHPDSRYESIPEDIKEGLLKIKDNKTAMSAIRMLIKANLMDAGEERTKKRKKV